MNKDFATAAAYLVIACGLFVMCAVTYRLSTLILGLVINHGF